MSPLSLLETNYQWDDCGLDSGYCKHCSQSAFDKSNDEEMSEMSSKEYPVREKKNRGKEGGKLPPPTAKNNDKMQLADEDVSAVLLALKKETSLQTTTQSSQS